MDLAQLSLDSEKLEGNNSIKKHFSVWVLVQVQRFAFVGQNGFQYESIWLKMYFICMKVMDDS